MAGSAINMVHKPGMVDERYRNVSDVDALPRVACHI